MLSMPPESESNTADTAEAIPDFQKPRPEVHTHEAQNGDESDHLKTEDGPTHPEIHAIDTNSVAEEPVSVETNRSQTGGGEMPSETNLAPLERETASEARDVRPEPETKPPEEVHATPDDYEASSPEVLNIEPVETTHDNPSTEAAGREVEENIEVNSYVPETQGTTPTFISTDSFAEGKGVDASEKGYLAVSEDTQVQGADDENVSLAEIPETTQNNRYSEAAIDGRNIEEASEHEAEHATQKPTHPNETAEHEPKVDSVKEHLDEVKEHANEKPSLSTSDADLLVEEQSIPDEESYVPVELHQEVPEGGPKLEKLQDTEAHAERKRNVATR